MGTYFKAIDRFAAALTRTVIARRWWVIAGAVVLAAIVGAGASRLEFSTNYRVFFSEANPELQAFENLQNTYTKNDNFFFVIEPRSGDAFNAETLAAVEQPVDVVMFLRRQIAVDHAQAAGHAQVPDGHTLVGLHQQVFGATIEALDTRPPDLLGKVRIHRPAQAVLADFTQLYLPAFQMGGQTAFGGFYFW